MSVTNLAKRRGEMLDEIAAHHRENLPRVMADVPFADVRAMAAVAPPPRDFAARRPRPRRLCSSPSARGLAQQRAGWFTP